MSDRLAPDKRFKFVHNGHTVYEWDQTVDEMEIFVPLPEGVPAKLFTCQIAQRHITVSIKGNPPYLDHDLAGPVKVDDSFWTIEDSELHISLQKAERGKTWPGALQGHALDAFSSDQEARRLMLERFQLENPGFDFSGAELTGSCPDPAAFLGGMQRQ